VIVDAQPLFAEAGVAAKCYPVSDRANQRVLGGA
jgi:hypothetical protein